MNDSIAKIMEGERAEGSKEVKPTDFNLNIAQGLRAKADDLIY